MTCLSLNAKLSTLNDPSLGVSNPTSKFKNEVFPDPLAPTIATRPSGISTETSSSRGRPRPLSVTLWRVQSMGSQGGNCRICTEVSGRKELKKTQKGSLLFCVFLSFLRPSHRRSRC